MRTLLLTLLAGSALAVGAVPASAASACKDVNGGFETQIRATNISCKTARAIVRRWHDKAVNQAQGPYGAKYVGSYVCKARSAGDPEHVIVNCANGTRKVRFFAGP